IIANNNDRANFGGNAKSDDGSLSGQEEFQDQGPAQPMNVHSTKITAITCDDMRQNATIFGEATIDGSAGTPPWIFRIDVRDMGSGLDLRRGLLTPSMRAEYASSRGGLTRPTARHRKTSPGGYLFPPSPARNTSGRQTDHSPDKRLRSRVLPPYSPGACRCEN